MTLGEIIKNFRLSSEEEMSIRRFAALSGLSAPYISLLERLGYNPILIMTKANECLCG